MAEFEQAPTVPPQPWFDTATGNATEAFRRFILGERGRVNNVNSGSSARIAQLEDQLAQERADRIAKDAALQSGVAGAGGGAASNGTVFTGIVSSGATWVVASTVTLTPGGAGGDYTVDVVADYYVNGHLSVETPAGGVFNGNWRLIEEVTTGGTEYTLATGTFQFTYIPRQIEAGFTIPESWTVEFLSLPSGLLPANNSAQSDIRLEIQRASGTNEIIAPGLSGSLGVVWTA